MNEKNVETISADSFFKLVLNGARRHRLYTAYCLALFLSAGIILLARQLSKVSVANVELALFILACGGGGMFVHGARGRLRMFLQWAIASLGVLAMASLIGLYLWKQVPGNDQHQHAHSRGNADVHKSTSNESATTVDSRQLALQSALDTPQDKTKQGGAPSETNKGQVNSHGVTKDFRLDDVKLDSPQLRTAFAVTHLGKQVYIATQGTAEVAHLPQLKASTTLLTTLGASEAPKELQNGRGISKFATHPKLRGIFGLKQDRVYRLFEGDPSWTRIFQDPQQRRIEDFTITQDGDIIARYDRARISRWLAASGYVEHEELRPPHRALAWQMVVGGGKVLSTIASGEPSLAQLWEGGNWHGVGDPSQENAPGWRGLLSANGGWGTVSRGVRALLFEGTEVKASLNVPAQGDDSLQVTAVTADSDLHITYVGTNQGLYFFRDGKLAKVEGVAKFLDVSAVFDLPGPEILIRAKPHSVIRARAYGRAEFADRRSRG